MPASATSCIRDDPDQDDQFDLLAGLYELFSNGGDSPLSWSLPSCGTPQPPSAVDAVDRESSSVATSPAAPEIAKPILTKRKNSTQRQKEEMQYLRSKVEELESQLRTLKRTRNEENSGCVWEEVAKRQLTARSNAEEERRRLQAVIRNQIKVARGIEKLLGDPEVWNHLQEENWREAKPPQKEDMQIFCEMLRHIDARYPQVDTYVGFATAMNGENDGNYMFELKSASVDGLCFEIKFAKFSPFDFTTVSEVAWDALRQGSFSSSEDQITVIMDSPDFVLSKLRAIAPPVIAEPTTAYQAVKRFPGENCERIVSELSALVPASPAANSPPFRVVSHRWGRLGPFEMGSGQTGSVMEERLLTTVTLLKPSNVTGQKKTKHCEIDILMRLLVSIYKEKQTLLRQVIENKLMDASIAARSTEPS